MDISLVTTTWNRKDYLRETMLSAGRSVVAPLTLNWEHVIYDDGSTDGTHELFDASPLPNVTYLRGSGNLGPSYGKNRAIEAAQGTYIIVLDSDDILLPRTLHNFFTAAKAQPDCRWFESDFLRVDATLSYRPGEDYWGWQFDSPSAMLEAIWKGEHFIQGNAMFEKSLWREAGGFDETLREAEDLDLYIRFLLKGALPRYLPFPSHLHRVHAQNLSHNITIESHKKTAEELRKKYVA